MRRCSTAARWFCALSCSTSALTCSAFARARDQHGVRGRDDDDVVEPDHRGEHRFFGAHEAVAAVHQRRPDRRSHCPRHRARGRPRPRSSCRCRTSRGRPEPRRRAWCAPSPHSRSISSARARTARPQAAGNRDRASSPRPRPSRPPPSAGSKRSISPSMVAA